MEHDSESVQNVDVLIGQGGLMTVPIHLVMAAVSLMQREADARSRRQEEQASAAARMAEIEFERERLEAELAAADRKGEREKEVLLSMLKSAENVHQMKVEAIVSMFRDAKSLLEGHQRALADEKAGLHRQLVQAELSAQTHVMIMKRQREIDQALSSVDDDMMDLTEKCVDVIANLHPDMGIARIEQTVTSGLMRLAPS